MYSSEQEVADILDELEIKWEYEPTLFELVVSKRGMIKEAFRPDFYLPEWDLYIEVTQARQSNTTRKNRKVRALRELHPEVQVELIYLAHFSDLRARVLEILENSDTLRKPLTTPSWKRSLGRLALDT